MYDRAKACIYTNGAYFEFKKDVFLACLQFLKKISPKTFGPDCTQQQNAGRDLKTSQRTETQKRYKMCHLRQNVLYTHLKSIIQIMAAHSVVVCNVG